MKLLQAEHSTLAEVKFIATATEVVIECLSVLKYAYVYDYYVEDNSPEQHIFVLLKDQLEKTIESLSKILEAPGILRRRTETVDLTKRALNTKDNLLFGVENV